ncbi:glycosyltransferase [Haloarcula hispanica]|uniref:Glycosyltransferase n=1 Tax=Haloarcula hispanica TaxID=51589 RepID=A0A5J5LCU4_HALHI|nr:glycosyltransferase [Haloarcula hispanica]
MGRRFWYDAYSRTTQDLLEHVQDIAGEQGSASAKVVSDDYLTDERKRELRVWELPVFDLGVLVGQAVAYLAVGLFVFRVGTAKAPKRGVLGH